MGTCKTCEYYKKDPIYALDGLCLLSKENNGKMEIADDYSMDPVLVVSENFGCVLHKPEK